MRLWSPVQRFEMLSWIQNESQMHDAYKQTMRNESVSSHTNNNLSENLTAIKSMHVKIWHTAYPKHMKERSPKWIHIAQIVNC